MIVGYARVSTSEQAEDENALTNQISRLKRAGAQRIYWDIDRRTNDRRKGIEQLLADVTSGGVRQLLFTRLDRLTASPLLFYELVASCRQCNVEVSCLDEPLDFETISGELGIGVRIVAAKYEVAMTAMRVKRIYDDRREQGKANYIAPFGYKVVCDRYVQDTDPFVCLLDGKQAFSKIDLVRLEVEKFLELRSLSATVRHLNELFGVTRVCSVRSQNEHSYWNTEDEFPDFKRKVTKIHGGLWWSTSGFSSRIRNPVLAGGTPYDTKKPTRARKNPEEWKVIWGTHDDEAIITPSQYFEIMEIISGNKRNKWAGDQPKKHPYSSFLRCDRCNSLMRSQVGYTNKTTGDRVYYYQCSYYIKRLCDNKQMISVPKIEEQLIPHLIAHAEAMANALVEPPQWVEPPEVAGLRSQILQLKAIGDSDVILDAIAKIEQKISTLLATKDTNAGLEHTKEDFIAAFSDERYYLSLPNPTKAVLLRQFIKSIFVDGGNIVNITYRF
jgi:DNA invertase Pin-like site-specific DNA recombinase